MAEPAVWVSISGLFLVAGALNLLRAIRSDNRRPVRLALAVSCLAWAGTAAAYRFAGSGIAIPSGVVAVALMFWAALLSMRR